MTTFGNVASSHTCSEEQEAGREERREKKVTRASDVYACRTNDKRHLDFSAAAFALAPSSSPTLSTRAQLTPEKQQTGHVSQKVTLLIFSLLFLLGTN